MRSMARRKDEEAIQREIAYAKASRKKIAAQRRERALRRKYGPDGVPAPVITRTVEAPSTLKVRRSDDPHHPLDARARDLGFRNYADYLRSDHWRGVRQHILARDGFRCTGCTSRIDLQVHHLTYESFGHERDDHLATLCMPCHRMAHGKAI